jgi:hypothetical protein
LSHGFGEKRGCADAIARFAGGAFAREAAFVALALQAVAAAFAARC